LGRLTSHQFGFARDVVAQNRSDIGKAHTVHMQAAGRATPLDKGKNCILVTEAGATLGLALSFIRGVFTGNLKLPGRL
jgi:hypothetical protein